MTLRFDDIELGDDLPPVNLGTGQTVAQVAPGGWHSCALLDAGRVKCWGYGDGGQLGLQDRRTRGDDRGEMGDALAAVEIGPGQVVGLTAGWDHACVLFDDGRVKCWGNNAYGQLGLGDRNSRGDDRSEMGANLPAVDLGTDRRAVEIDAGANHTCARLDNGTIKCWGLNDFGQLGVGDAERRGDGPEEMGDALSPVRLW